MPEPRRDARRRAAVRTAAGLPELRAGLDNLQQRTAVSLATLHQRDPAAAETLRSVHLGLAGSIQELDRLLPGSGGVLLTKQQGRHDSGLAGW